MPRVNIITPCHNYSRFVARAIESVRAQTFSDWEHVIVDDCSDDGSPGVIQDVITGDNRFTLIRRGARGGASAARNTGVAAISPGSTYLLFLDADDCLDPGMLATLVDYMDARPQVGLAYCRFAFVDEQDDVVGEKNAVRHAPGGPPPFGVRIVPTDQPETPFPSVYAYCGIVPSVALIRRSVYEETPGWDESLPQANDRDLLSHVALRTEVHFVPRRMVRKRVHQGQLTVDRDRVREADRRFYDKWRGIQGLTPEQEAMVRKAAAFRERRLVPYLFAAWGQDHLRQRRLLEGAKCYLRCARQMVRSRLTDAASP